MKNNKKYLGDGVYIEFDGYHHVLTTENGISASNTIALDPHVTEALLQHLTSNVGDPDEDAEVVIVDGSTNLGDLKPGTRIRFSGEDVLTPGNKENE